MPTYNYIHHTLIFTAEKKSVDTVGEQVENITVGHNEREQLLNDDQSMLNSSLYFMLNTCMFIKLYYNYVAGGHRADTVAHNEDNNNHNHRRATGRHCSECNCCILLSNLNFSTV